MGQIDVIETIKDIATNAMDRTNVGTAELLVVVTSIASICKGAIDMNKPESKEKK